MDHLVQRDGRLALPQAGNGRSLPAEDTAVLLPAQASPDLIDHFHAFDDRVVQRNPGQFDCRSRSGGEDHGRADTAIRRRSGQIDFKRLSGRRQIEGGGLIQIGREDFHLAQKREDLPDQPRVAAHAGGVFFPGETQVALVVRISRSGLPRRQFGQKAGAFGNEADEFPVQFAGFGNDASPARRARRGGRVILNPFRPAGPPRPVGLALTVPAAVAGRKRAGLSVPAVAVRRAGTGFVRTACEGAVAHENLLSGCGRGAVGGKRRKQERRQSLIPILKAPAPQVREVMQLMSSFASGALMTPARGARPAGFARAGRSAGTNQQRCCDRADWC